MPVYFQYSFGKKVTVIIDCLEVFIEEPSNLLARAQTFSNYKHHNTIKILIAILYKVPSPLSLKHGEGAPPIRS